MSKKSPFFIIGPCLIESQDIASEIATTVSKLAQKYNFKWIFKGSFDKANRTSVDSFRSIGFDAALNILSTIKQDFNVNTLTDIHEVHQVDPVSQVVDILQIPAFLCRQTDLLVAAGQSKKTINIKKGQFMAAADMAYAVKKVESTGNKDIWLTERGTSFGYHDLVVDFRSLVTMKSIAPVIYDVTHSVQQPGGQGGKSGGKREFTLPLARAAAAVGVDGFFMEVHPDPANAKSDQATMIQLSDLESVIKNILEVAR